MYIFFFRFNFYSNIYIGLIGLIGLRLVPQGF